MTIILIIDFQKSNTNIYFVEEHNLKKLWEMSVRDYYKIVILLSLFLVKIITFFEIVA